MTTLRLTALIVLLATAAAQSGWTPPDVLPLPHTTCATPLFVGEVFVARSSFPLEGLLEAIANHGPVARWRSVGPEGAPHTYLIADLYGANPGEEPVRRRLRIAIDDPRGRRVFAETIAVLLPPFELDPLRQVVGVEVPAAQRSELFAIAGAYRLSATPLPTPSKRDLARPCSLGLSTWFFAGPLPP
jgi:hypothetical protein